MAVKMAKKDDQEQRQAEKTEISLAEEKGVSTIALNFTPEDGKHFHPQAREKIQLLFNFFSQCLSSENWLKPLQFYLANIDDGGLLWVSTDIARAAQPFYDLDLQNNDIQLTLLLCRLDLDISNIKVKWTDLMKKAVEPYTADVIRQTKEAAEEARKKEVKAEETAKKAEYKRKWDEAVEHVYPLQLQKDVKRYLPGNKREVDEAVRKAIAAYIKEGPDKYLDSFATYDYRVYRRTINELKEEEEQKATAKRNSWEFNRLLTKEVERIRSLLLLERQNPEDYFEKMSAELEDLRYSGQSFADFLSPDVERSLHTAIFSITKVKIDELLPEPFAQFTTWESTISYFPLPRASYRDKGVACFDFELDVYAVVELKIWLKPGQKRFDGYTFPLPQIEHKVEIKRTVEIEIDDAWASYFVALQEPEFLGYHYLVLAPSEFVSVSWQSIPLVLLKGLLRGEEKPAGTTPSGVEAGMTTHKIPGFKEEVEIPESFASYLKEIGSLDVMAALGIVTEKIANFAKSEKVLNLPRQVQGSKLSKKEQLNLLFDEGKKPSAAEVKNLGIKPNTVYRYYQAWKKAHNI